MTEEQIIAEALDLDRSQRASFLNFACGDDESLRNRAVELLAAHANEDSLLDAGDNVTIHRLARVATTSWRFTTIPFQSDAVQVEHDHE